MYQILMMKIFSGSSNAVLLDENIHDLVRLLFGCKILSLTLPILRFRQLFLKKYPKCTPHGVHSHLLNHAEMDRV